MSAERDHGSKSRVHFLGYSLKRLKGQIKGQKREKRSETLWFQTSCWQREKDSNPHIRSQSPLCYHYTIPLCSLDEHLLLYQWFCICQELIANFPDFFHFGAAGCFRSAFQRQSRSDGAGGKRLSRGGEVPVPRVRAVDGGRPERSLAVSAEGKSANFTDLVKMPIPFCTLSCYTAYIKASERSTDYDRNEPQC